MLNESDLKRPDKEKRRKEEEVPAFGGGIFWMALEKTLKNAIRKDYLQKALSDPFSILIST